MAKDYEEISGEIFSSYRFSQKSWLDDGCKQLVLLSPPNSVILINHILQLKQCQAHALGRSQASPSPSLLPPNDLNFTFLLSELCCLAAQSGQLLKSLEASYSATFKRLHEERSLIRYFRLS